MENHLDKYLVVCCRCHRCVTSGQPEECYLGSDTSKKNVKYKPDLLKIEDKLLVLDYCVK